MRAGVRHPLNEAGERGDAPTTPGADGCCGLDSRGGCGRRETALTRGPGSSAAVEREGRAATVAARVGRPKKERGGGRVGPRGKKKAMWAESEGGEEIIIFPFLFSKQIFPKAFSNNF